MKLISQIEIDHFRSLRDEKIAALADFTAFAGPNNSGKSNILRALNAFFNDQTDAGSAVNFPQDYYRHDLRSKKAKRFRSPLNSSFRSHLNFGRGSEKLRRS